jgi:hypothetical protein
MTTKLLVFQKLYVQYQIPAGIRWVQFLGRKPRAQNWRETAKHQAILVTVHNGIGRV